MFKSLFLICFLLSAALPAVASSDAKPAWDSLTPKQRAVWDEFLAPSYGGGEGATAAYKTMYNIVADSDSVTSEALRREDLTLENNLCAQRILSADFQKQAGEPSDEDLREYAAASPLSFNRKERINLDSIHLRRFDSETSESLKARAAKVKEAIDSGEDFGALAERYSDARSRAIRGSAGTIERGQLPPDMEKLVFDLPVGKIVGPIERKQGIYFWRVTGRLGEFTLDNKDDRKRVHDGWVRAQVGKRFQTLVDAYQAAHKVETHSEPVNPETWLQEPWITVDGKPVLLFSSLYALVTQEAPALPDERKWSDGWKDEASLRAGQMVMGLAALEHLGKEDERVRDCAAMESLMSAGKALIHMRYQQLEPTAEEIASHYQENIDLLDPLQPRYTALVWDWRPESLREKKISSKQLTEGYTEALNQVYDRTHMKNPATEQDATALMEELCRAFPGSQFKRFADIDSIGPFIDPILFRTDSGHLSRPFDRDRLVSIVYMIDRTKARKGIEASKEMVKAHWREKTLNDYINAHRP